MAAPPPPPTSGDAICHSLEPLARDHGGSNVSIGGITIIAAPGQSPQMIARAIRDEMQRLAREARFALDDGAAHA